MIGSRFGYYASQKSVAPSLLLDLYPSNTVLAQSVRKLRTAYTGNAEEVRVDEVGQPQYNIGFNGEDLDEAALVSNANGNDAFLANWYDQENANNFPQSQAARQAKVVNAGSIIKEGGKPTVSFGSGGMATSSAVALGGATELWLFIAVDIGSTNPFCYFYQSSFFYGAILNTFAIVTVGNEIKIRQNSSDGQNRNEATINIGLQLWTIRLVGGQLGTDAAELWINGSPVSLTNTFSNLSPTSYGDYPHFLGARDNINNVFQGNISEVILKTGNQSANRAGIEANMAAYYGITI